MPLAPQTGAKRKRSPPSTPLSSEHATQCHVIPSRKRGRKGEPAQTLKSDSLSTSKNSGASPQAWYAASQRSMGASKSPQCIDHQHGLAQPGICACQSHLGSPGATTKPWYDSRRPMSTLAHLSGPFCPPSIATDGESVDVAAPRDTNAIKDNIGFGKADDTVRNVGPMLRTLPYGNSDSLLNGLDEQTGNVDHWMAFLSQD
ncbi:hypothetical protein Slin15195_G129630 [Septoria linicola]|uniref:Uncharacterized protein n=1 Tax=Septoria linicola TaxID=215465 RepID=A0A9Q9B2B2_9PEZI|nr:hypothetical protein Slin15195_G129630 [Septoria linicola]